MNLLFIILLFPISNVITSFCGQNSIPFSFQALKSGQPVLGCARPICFGSSNAIGEPAQFYRIHGKEDGYLRKSEGSSRSTNQISACSMSFSSSSCGIGQWVGGISPQADVKGDLHLRCCSYGPLLQSEDRGIATVKSGQLVVGGEVTVNGRIVAFDYVSDMSKTMNQDGSVQYNVALRRMNCFDEPIVPSVSSNQIIGQPSDELLQQIEEKQKPVPYSPWGYQQIPQQQQIQYEQVESKGDINNFQPIGQISQTSTSYPGQPLNLQPEPMQSQKNTIISPPSTISNPSSNQSHQYTQQQSLSSQQTYMNPQLNPMIAQAALIQQQQLALQQMNALQAQQAQSQAALLAAQQQLLAAQQGRVQQQNQGVMGGTIPMQSMTLPPLPKLEQLPKLNIPSIEEVENAIPPVEKAILTTVARFFGVL